MPRYVVIVVVRVTKEVTVMAPKIENVLDVVVDLFHRGDVDTTVDSSSTVEILEIAEVT